MALKGKPTEVRLSNMNAAKGVFGAASGASGPSEAHD